MGIFSNQFADVVEWNNPSDDIILHRFEKKEIKKGSRLIIRPGQAAIFLNNGNLEGIFEDEGNFDIDSGITPLLASLKGFRYGFSSGMRAEVIFVNTRIFMAKWGTKQPINLPYPGLPGGIPVRANGTFHFKVGDYLALIDQVSGIRNDYTVFDVRERILAFLEPILRQALSQGNRDLFELQERERELAHSILEDLDMQVIPYGLTITDFAFTSITYPREIQNRIENAAGRILAGEREEAGPGLNFCPDCGYKTAGSRFCPNCGKKLG